MTTLTHWIDGAPAPIADDARRADLRNPATGERTGEVVLASRSETEAAIASAAAAFPAWRDTSLSKRVSVLFAFRELLNARKEELAAIITAEQGKVLADALGEISRGQEVV